jgi:hypothetical protein
VVEMTDPAEVLRAVCRSLGERDLVSGAATLRRDYPFEPLPNAGRQYTPFQCMEVFLCDGFCDRYTGQCLVNPAVLRLVSALLPKEFPAHPNWKQSESHIGFWELFPTIDHLVPVARGGADAEDNWVTTSMFRNSAKGNALLEELGWELQPRGDLASWDGLTDWVIEYVASDPELNSITGEETRHRAYIQRWVRASTRARDDVR